MKKKRFTIIVTIAFLIFVEIFTLSFKSLNKKEALDEVKLKDIEKSNSMFAIMVEQDGGNYSEQKGTNTWPGTGYYFNNVASGCVDDDGKEVDDATLNFDIRTKKASVSTNKTVYCYLYFSKDSELPDVTNFYVGTKHGSEYTNVKDKKKVHIEWNDEDVTDYCLTTTNSTDGCSWQPISGIQTVGLDNEIMSIASTHTAETTVDLGTENKKYDYDVYLKDKADNISKLDEASQDEIILDTQAPTITNLKQSANAETSVTVSLNVSDPAGTDESAGSGVDKVYFKIKPKSGGNYIGSEASENASTNTVTHTFDSGLTAGTEYTVEVHAKDKVTNDSSVTTVEVTTKALSKPGDIVQQSASTSDLKNSSIGDLTKRFVGSNPKNYICFGNGTTCTTGDNYMYRIIGITENGELKIQKYSSLGKMKWHDNSSDDVKWNTSNSSNLFTSLNNSGFLTNDTYTVSEQWRNLILSKTWNIGDIQGTGSGYTTNATEVYNKESATPSSSYKIGLMYLSDYYLALDGTGTTNCYNTACKSWMFHSENEWTMSRYGQGSNGYYRAWGVASGGNVNWPSLYNTDAVRPVFYLSSEAKIKSAKGSSDDPYIVEL